LVWGVLVGGFVDEVVLGGLVWGWFLGGVGFCGFLFWGLGCVVFFCGGGCFVGGVFFGVGCRWKGVSGLFFLCDFFFGGCFFGTGSVLWGFGLVGRSLFFVFFFFFFFCWVVWVFFVAVFVFFVCFFVFLLVWNPFPLIVTLSLKVAFTLGKKSSF